MNSNQNGRSMMEMLGVLAIVGILTTTGMTLYAKALQHRKIGNTIDQFVELSTNIKNSYIHRRNYDTLKSSDMDGEGKGPDKDPRGIVPSGMWSGNNIKNAMGGSVAFAGVSGSKTFQVAFSGLNKPACLKLASSNWGTGTYVCAGTGTVAYPNTSSLGSACAEVQLSVGTANTKCSCADDTCYVSWLVK